MAPEVLEGAEPTPACDQYSLGVLAFELLTGELPFEDQDEIRDLPQPLRALAPGTSDDVLATIQRALAPDPNDRFPSVLALARSNANSHTAFEMSTTIGETVDRVQSDSELVLRLTDQGLSDARIAEISDLERSRIVLLRRRAARRSIVGE